jgi:hypothetical protein
MQKKIAVGFTGFMLLLLWLEISKYWSFSLIIVGVMFALIARNSFTYAMAKKVCLGKCYFSEGSFLYFFWTRPAYIFIVSLMIAFILTSSFILATFQFSLVDKTIFFVDTFVLIYLHTLLEKNQTFSTRVKTPMIKNIASSINAIMVVVVFFVVALYEMPPEYLEVDLSSTLFKIEKMRYSESDTIDIIAYMSSAIVATKWWLLTQATVMLEDGVLKKVLWFLQLLGNYMVVFAYGRYILELVDILTLKKDSNNEK